MPQNPFETLGPMTIDEVTVPQESAAAAAAPSPTLTAGMSIHFHPEPRCKDGKHADTCAQHGPESFCIKVSHEGTGGCVCFHHRKS